MAKIQSGSSTDELDIVPVAKAAKTRFTDTRGQDTGMKPSYMASLTLKTATAAGTGVFAAIYGSASKTIRVQRITVCGTVATAAVYGDVVVKKVTTPGTGGTATTLTPVACDSNTPDSFASCSYFTALRTAGSGGGAIASQVAYFPITGTVANGPAIIQFVFTATSMLEAPVLRGTSQGIELNFGTTTTNAPTLMVTFEWTEED